MIEDDVQGTQTETAPETSRQRLRELALHQQLLLEEVRKHIARDVHDELGALLTALRMDAALLVRAVAGEPALETQAKRMGELVERTLDVVRHIANNLRPAALDLGLVPAIEWLAEDFSLRYEMPCQLQVEGDAFEPPDPVATALFRVVQESLTNVARHAAARRVDIRMTRRDDRIVLMVSDDGGGFDPAAVRDSGRFGLLGMQERVLKLGGSFEVESGVGGSVVCIEIPEC